MDNPSEVTLHSSYELLCALKKGEFYNSKDELWWPNSGSFEIVIGSILTQNTKWANVQKALANLEGKTNLETIANMDIKELALRIKPSGFYNTKAKYLKNLAKNIHTTFESFEVFTQEVTPEWLLSQRGVGHESCDGILCYACKRDEMVADAYSYKLLVAFGIELEGYEEVKDFLARGIYDNIEKVHELYGTKLPINTIFARFHGKIVDYCSTRSHKKEVNIQELLEFM